MSTYLKDVMKEMKLSQQALSSWTGLNQGRISLFCNGLAAPSKNEKKLLERAFNLSTNVLLEPIGDE